MSEYKEKIKDRFFESYYSTENEDYTASELATVAEDILGYRKALTLDRTFGLGSKTKQIDIYDTEDGEGVSVKWGRREVYEAIEEANEMLENNEVEVIK